MNAAEVSKREKKLESQRLRKQTLYNTDPEYKALHKARCKEYGARVRAAAREERDKKIGIPTTVRSVERRAAVSSV